MTPPAHVRRMLLGLIGLLAAQTGPAAAQAQSATLPGVTALERMRRAYDGKWYQTLTFVQHTIVSRNGGAPDTTVWYETVSGPARLRIDMGLPSAGNGAIYTADSMHVVRNGALARSVGAGNPFLPLIMGVYLQPVAETARQVALFGFDLSKVTTGSWEGRPVTIVGASSALDSASAQFWIEDERQVVVRVRGAVRGTGGAEVVVGRYVRAGEGWLGTRVSINGPAVSQIEEYSEWKVDVPVSEELFDVTKWRSAPHWAPPARQEFTGNATVDSAAVARAAWQRATAALRAGDLAAARAQVNRAATAWPTQEAYVWARASLAARANDTTALLTALGDYARLGLGRDLAREPALASFVGAELLKPFTARHAANRAPINRGMVRETLSDSTFWPEGVDYDPRTGAYYVASVRHGTIAEVLPSRRSADRSPATAPPATRELIARGTKGIGAILGVRVDPARGVLWATTAGIPQFGAFVPSDSTIAALLEVRIRDGAVIRRFDLPPSPNGHVLGDLAIGPRGDVFVTDSRDPVLYRLAPGADSLVAIRNVLFRSLQGIAPAPDGATVYVADWSHGILRVSLATGRVDRIADAPGSVSLGCDGIAWYHGSIIAVQNGVAPARVMRFTLAADGLRFATAVVIDRNPAVADEPTIGTIAGNAFVYVANSQWEKYDDSGKRVPGAPLAKPVLIAVPLKP